MAKTKLAMDSATRKKLMGYSLISDSLNFTPEIDGVDEQYLPTFKIKALSAEDQRKLKFMFLESMDTKKVSDKDKIRKDDLLSELTKKHIVGFSNLLDISTDEIVEWKTKDGEEHIDDKLFDSLPTMLKVLIMNEILKMNGLA